MGSGYCIPFTALLGCQLQMFSHQCKLTLIQSCTNTRTIRL